MKDFSFHTLNKKFVSSKLIELPDEKDLILALYGITDSYSISLFKSLWAKFDNSTKAVGRDEKHTKKVEGENVGGAITLIDLNLETKTDPEVLVDMDIMNPYAAYYHCSTEELLIGSAYTIYAIKGGEITRALDNNLFNSIHSIKPSSKGIYVVSTAVDSIIEIDPNDPKKILWDWIAPEHGLNISPKGEIVYIDKNINYQTMGAIGSSHQATHINSVEIIDENYLLATLFHQDQLIKIDKSTGNYEVVFDDLVNPHGIHKVPTGYIVSDTRGNRAILLDKKFKIQNIIKGDFNWVQESIYFNDYYVIANDNKGRIDIYNQKLLSHKNFNWNTSQRMISGLYKINAKQAKRAFVR